MEFRLFEEEGKVNIYRVRPDFCFICGFNEDQFISPVAGDIVEFLNDKYVDKNMNEEWYHPDREARIKYHEEQLKILRSGKPIGYTEHGNGVK